MLKSIEVSGKSLDAAIEKGLRELGLESKEQVEVKVLKDNGFLFNKYKVLVSRKRTEGEIATEFVEGLLERMNFNFVTETEENEESIQINLIGTDSAAIIGYRGEVLDAVQYLTSLIANRDKESYKRLTIDTEGYRQKRAETLVQLAKNLESKVKRTGRTVKLEPMNPYERRIIHSALQDSEVVVTVSEGVSPARYVTIVPKSPYKKEFKKNNNGGKPSKSGFKGNGNSDKDKKPFDKRHKKPFDKGEKREKAVRDNETVAAAAVVKEEPQVKAQSTKTSMNFAYSSEKKRRKSPMAGMSRPQ